LSWKIREGLRRKIETERIKKYSDWFWENHLVPHLEFEEKYIYPILGGKENPIIKRALREHRRLKRLFTAPDRVERNLSLIEEELVAHIRFEERILFKEIQNVASEAQLKAIENAYPNKIIEDDWNDEFWLRE